MSFIENTLPPGDRDEAPALLPLDDRPQDAGRDAAAPAFIPGTALTIDAIARQLDNINMAYGELRMAQTQQRLPAFKAAALRLAGLTSHLSNTLAGVRPRGTSSATKGASQ
ncbi:MAG: hypothetical protein AB7F39_06805 [Variibacter sp.]